MYCGDGVERGYELETTSCSPIIFKQTKSIFEIDDAIISKKQAIRVIQLLNTFQERFTLQALEILFYTFIWRFNRISKSERYFINISFIREKNSEVIRRKERRPTEQEHGTNTSSTDGWNLWINRKNIMNKKFDLDDSHFGELPSGVSHYAVVILHEFGHVLRERANKTTFSYLMDNSPIIRKCFREFQRYIHKPSLSTIERETTMSKKKKDELEEWIADMFAKSFVLYAITDNKGEINTNKIKRLATSYSRMETHTLKK
jgi:hypothetical protein